MAKNLLYAQSGGVTAVINNSARAVIETAKQHPRQINKVYAAHNGILGALTETLIDTSVMSDAQVNALGHTPAGAFGSCRYKLKGLHEHRAEYERLMEVFAAHDIGYFLYNGGGDSQDTAHKVSQLGQEMGYPIQCVGVPKTIDNDLAITDNCPGFGSVAKYVAIAIQEAGMDVASMAASSTKVFVLEVMGRHAGWIAAAGGLAQTQPNEAPHLILLPEVPFDAQRFLDAVKHSVNAHGYCAIVASEGTKDSTGTFLADSGNKDAFGHAQLGGVATVLCQMIKDKLGYKYHYAIADYLQRSARHIASQTDVDQAYALGRAAVEAVVAGKNAIMPTIVRTQNEPYVWTIGEASLSDVANIEKKLPPHFISDNGMHITQAAKDYLAPLIQGEAYPPYQDGLPAYLRCEHHFLNKKLADFVMVN